MNKSLLKIDVLPTFRIFDERENGMVHTPYEIETAFFSCISKGSEADLRMMLQKFVDSGITTGKLSSNNIRQIQYWAVCCITLGTRYAIAGGANETVCFNFSDECILTIDKMNNEVDILDYLFEKSIELTNIVKESKFSNYSGHVKKCLKIINTHLFDELNLSYLAKECSLSKDHLSMIFKKATGCTIPQYIKNERLEASKELLCSGMSVSQTAYTLGFGTESHFIKSFKDKFGTTPGKYTKQGLYYGKIF